jgi:hypothetical protein
MKQPAATYLVFEFLVARTKVGEFSTVEEIASATGVTRANVLSALWALQHYFSAVEAVRAVGTLHWIATPETDKRTKTLKERTPETKPRRVKMRKRKGELQ